MSLLYGLATCGSGVGVPVANSADDALFAIQVKRFSVSMKRPALERAPSTTTANCCVLVVLARIEVHAIDHDAGQDRYVAAPRSVICLQPVAG